MNQHWDAVHEPPYRSLRTLCGNTVGNAHSFSTIVSIHWRLQIKNTTIFSLITCTVSVGSTVITQISFCSLVTILTLQTDSLICSLICQRRNYCWKLKITTGIESRTAINSMSVEVSDHQYDTIKQLCISLIMSNKTLGTKEASRFPEVPYNTVQHIYRFDSIYFYIS